MAISTSLIAAWIALRIVMLWDNHGRGFPESWGRKPYLIAPLVAAIGWIVWFVLTK